MAFYRDPIIPEEPKCIVCDTVMYDRRWEDGLVCSATCADIWLMGTHGPDYDVDQEELRYA